MYVATSTARQDAENCLYWWVTTFAVGLFAAGLFRIAFTAPDDPRVAWVVTLLNAGGSMSAALCGLSAVLSVGLTLACLGKLLLRHY